MSETKLMREIQLYASKRGARLFRNNVGVGWMGTPCYPCQKRLTRLRYGLCVGSSDLIGWTKDGHFFSVEVKAGSRTSKEQVAWLKQVIQSGGIGIVAHSVEDLNGL